jgi:hypothetical protein
MKYIKMLFAVVLVLWLSLTMYGYSHAGSMVVNVNSLDGSGAVVPGAKVVFKFVGGWKTVYTNSLGKASFLYHNWCDTPQAVCSKTGYFSAYRSVGEGSCWGCYPECDPAYAEWGCKQTLTVSFKMIKNPFVKPLALRPEVATAENRNEIIQAMLGIWVATYCNRNICDYDCLYQGVVDFFNGREYAYGKPTSPDIELPPCPDVVTFVDFVNNWLDAMWEYYYGDNFPDEE